MGKALEVNISYLQVWRGSPDMKERKKTCVISEQERKVYTNRIRLFGLSDIVFLCFLETCLGQEARFHHMYTDAQLYRQFDFDSVSKVLVLYRKYDEIKTQYSNFNCLFFYPFSGKYGQIYCVDVLSFLF